MSLRYVSIIFVAAMLAMAVVLAATAAQPKKAEAANTVAVKGCTGTKVALKTVEKRMLDLHNKTRTDRGLPRLCVHPALQRAARWYSQERVDKNYYHADHTSYNGEQAAARVKRFGYKYRIFGENVSWGSGISGSADTRFKRWMKSPGHRANILNKNFREIGIGAATGTYGPYRDTTQWTVDFGAR